MNNVINFFDISGLTIIDAIQIGLLFSFVASLPFFFIKIKKLSRLYQNVSQKLDDFNSEETKALMRNFDKAVDDMTIKLAKSNEDTKDILERLIDVTKLGREQEKDLDKMVGEVKRNLNALLSILTEIKSFNKRNSNSEDPLSKVEPKGME